jgi:hypothetical protein
MLILFADSPEELEREADEEVAEESPRLVVDRFAEDVLETEAA